MRFVEANNRMSKAIGLPVISISIGAVALSGAAAGMGGLVLASQQGRLSADFVSGYGFAGIIIAFLSRNNPISVALVALLIAMLFDAGRSLQVFNQIPFSMVQLVEAIIVMSVAASEFFVRHRLRWSRV
jgi:simple sugar transport system permease protein